MAHFAQIDADKVVLRVVVIHNDELLVDGVESEGEGFRFCQTLFGGGDWVQTSYNGSFRKNFAGIGFTYDPVRDAFIPPQPLADWILDEETCRWVDPAGPTINVPSESTEFSNPTGDALITEFSNPTGDALAAELSTSGTEVTLNV